MEIFGHLIEVICIKLVEECFQEAKSGSLKRLLKSIDWIFEK
jgi:hypothetical protein